MLDIRLHIMRKTKSTDIWTIMSPCRMIDHPKLGFVSC